MALSMFLRKPGCINLAMSQQMMKMGTQSSIQHSAFTRALSTRILSAQKTKSASIINSVRSFRTTPVHSTLEKLNNDHSKVWLVEKAVSALLIPLIPIGLMMPNKVVDSIVAILLSAHCFWGWEAIARDYVRACIFGPVLPKVALVLVYLVSFATLGGLFYIINHDIGLANTVRKTWGIKPSGA